jgi:hypothetical protein
MTEKELFEIALKYINKGYNIEDLRYGDDLYNASPEEKQQCIEFYDEIQDEGTKWANEYLKTL